ncbi:transcription factor SEF1 [Fusarium acutatum]|uniref:Transcription factor SEF1 n=1 Tax=Fusarium acutatum TaxID=78861 RepID=A0A8H4JEN5_9HYPO|nr:transcription factor SEF1 [Fusarium acutatum]
MSSIASTRSSSPSSHTDSHYSTAPIGTTQDTAATTFDGCARGGEAWLQLKAVEIPSSYQLGSLSLNNTVALDLFQHYYRPHAKFLRPIRTSLSEYSQSSPHLFWTIILCSSQMHPKHAHMYSSIVTEHEAMLSVTVLRAPLTIEMMHALLCLCLWPVPKLRLWQDLSWGYIGLAVNSAMQLNCHLPSNPLLNAQIRRNASRRAVPNIDAAVRDTTWLACFDINTREFLGFPSLLSSGYYLNCVSRAREQASNLLGPSYHRLLDIRLLTVTSMSKLGMITDSALHFSQTQSSMNDLQLLRSSDQHSWSPQTELTLQGAKLYLYAMTLLLPPPKDPILALQAISNRDAVLISGLMCASTMISRMLHHDKPNQVSDKITCSAAFWPKTQISYLFFAATFIFRVLLSHSSLTPQDITLAMSRLADAHAIFRMEPLHPDRTRAAEIIQRLIKVARAYMMKDSDENNAKDLLPRALLVTGRLGASVMFDAVLRSVHHHRKKAQRHEARSLKSPRVTPIPGTEVPAGGEASSSTGLIGHRQSVEAHGNVPDGLDGIGFGDMFDFEFMDAYEYIMNTDSSLMLDSLEGPGFRT